MTKRLTCLAIGRLAMAASVALLASCQRREFEIDLKPTPGGLERTVILGSIESQKQSSPKADNGAVDKPYNSEIARLAAIYDGQPPTRKDGRTVFGAKVFLDQMPQDIGGSGHYVRFESPLGSAAAYVERFRGNDDFHGQFEARPKAVNQFVDLGIGWLESEFGKEPGWPAIKEFLDTTFRRDLLNASMFSWSAAVMPIGTTAPNESAAVEFVLRTCQYFVERGYFTYDELPALARDVEDAQRGDTTAIVARIQKIVAKQIGKTQSPVLPEAFSLLLRDKQRVAESWQKYFEQTEYFREKRSKLLADQEKELAAIRRDESDPEAVAAAEAMMLEKRKQFPDQLISQLWLAAFMPWFDMSGFDRLNIALATDSAPVFTNGQWNAEKKQVVWSEAVKVADENPSFPFNWPNFVFAIWDKPNTESQLRLFGSVAVDGKKLVNYCLWYATLTAAEKQQWETFIATLKPNSESRNKLKNFRFAGEPREYKSGGRIAFKGIETISGGLEKSKE